MDSDAGLMTVEEYHEYSHRDENRDRRLELWRGRLVETPWPPSVQGLLSPRFAFALHDYAERIGRGHPTLGGVGIVLRRNPDTLAGPPIAYWAGGEAELFGWPTEPPIAVAEFEWPDSPLRASERVADYLESGVRVVWVVDWPGRLVRTHTVKGTEVAAEGGVVRGGTALPGFEMPIAMFFRQPGDHSFEP